MPTSHVSTPPIRDFAIVVPSPGTESQLFGCGHRGPTQFILRRSGQQFAPSGSESVCADCLVEELDDAIACPHCGGLILIGQKVYKVGRSEWRCHRETCTRSDQVQAEAFWNGVSFLSVSRSPSESRLVALGP